MCLHEAGIQPVIIDNLVNSKVEAVAGIESIVQQKVPFYQVDCNDKKALLEVFEKEPGIEGVIHFAADKAVGESVESPLKYYQNNIGSTVTLLTVMKELGVRNLVFSSSCTVYGEPDTLPVDENAPIKEATSPYGYTKQVCERIIQDFVKANTNYSSVLLRYFNPIGAHPSAAIGELPLGVPNNLVPFITQTAAGIREKITVFGNDYDTPDGTCVRDYIHVMDLAQAHVDALKWLSDLGESKCEVLNVGTGNGNTVLDVIHTFEKVNELKLNYVIGPRRGGDVEKVYADAKKVKATIGWSAQRTLGDALKDAWRWQETLPKP